ncbi:MAG: hypothetical protein NC938_07035 [Candidatus Omnitrophica bacterium]|nr:hypothetical protein [Candidatus Omnitrophota bacterium]MCM8791422.1 hypothetical protein [Candidatus Omnitrophota bacterium]
MDKVRPVFIRLLIAAATVYVIGTTFILSELIEKIGRLEFEMIHLTGKCTAHHK